jgi:hypothetical protein
MTLSAATGFEVKGSLLNQGILQVNSNDSGLLKFSGVGTKQISGGGSYELNNLSIANAGGSLTIQDDLEIPGSMFMESGSALTFGTGNIKLKSSAERTARIGPLQNVTIQYTGSGRFIIQRYISAGRKWRHLSVPINSDTLKLKNSWQQSMLLTGNNSDWSSQGFDAFSPGGASVKYFDAVLRAYRMLNTTDTLLRNPAGYMVYVRGDRTCLPGNATLVPTTLNTAGPIYIGDQVMPVAPGGFSSLGNPFASSIDIRKLVKSQFDTSFIYVWDPKLTGSYGLGGMQTLKFKSGNYYAVPGGGSYADSNSINNLIQSGQAFFVHHSGTNAGSLTFTEASKELGSRLVFRSMQNEDYLKAYLYRQADAPSASQLLDGWEIEFTEDASDEMDAQDARKFPNSAENIGIDHQGQLYVIESRKPLKNRDTIYFQITGLKPGKYLLRLHSLLREKELTGFLADHYLRRISKLTMEGSTEYQFEVKDAESASPQRFHLFFRKGRASVEPTKLSRQKTDFSNKTGKEPVIFPNPVKGRKIQLKTSVFYPGEPPFLLTDLNGLSYPIITYTPVSGGWELTLPAVLPSGSYLLSWISNSVKKVVTFVLTN